MNYTEDQQAALKNMNKWLETDDLFYVLDGAAGTGKTTITKAFIKQSGLRKGDIAVTAPTHKAKRVIAKSTGYRAKTIQKLLGLRPNTELDNFDIENPQFDPLGRQSIGDYEVIILDESSMLNKDSFKFITDAASRYETKVLFLGDAYQLPPVKEKLSKVFTAIENKSTLTTVVRQGEDNPNMDILIKLREDIDNNTTTGLELLYKTKKHINLFGKGYSGTKEGGLFGSEMLKLYLSTESESDYDFVKFISYTNSSIEKWSVGLREKILGERAKDLVIQGEYLLGYNSIQDAYGGMILENSRDYKVSKVVKGEDPSTGYKGYYITIGHCHGSEMFNTRTVFIVSPESYPAFKEILFKKKKDAIQGGKRFWARYFTFKNKYLVFDTLYHNGEFLCKKDLYYNYGITTHKSQGSTYNTVCLNLRNIIVTINKNSKLTFVEKRREINKLVYVAMSRASTKNLILI